MPNTNPRSTVPSRVCPTCGTRIAVTAARCAVCGMEFEPSPGRPVLPSPKMTGAGTSFNLPLGIVIGAPALFMIAGALIIVLFVRVGLFPSNNASVPTASITPTITLTFAPTNTEAPTVTPSPLPPIEITVQAGETCWSYVNTTSLLLEIIKLNKLNAECTDLVPGQHLFIPQPTPTQPPPATATFEILEQTRSACPLQPYEVKEGDALSSIADNYNVSIESIKEWNPNIAGNTLFSGLTIQIPLCRRLPTAGPTPTATIPPPYQAPNLLTPKDGVVYGVGEDTIALQWASVATLRENEVYQVTIEDMSSTTEKKWVEYVTDTRYIVPTSLRPTDSSTHVFRWSVAVVRQTGSTDAGKPIYVPAGAASERRVFAWGGTAPAAASPAP